MIRVGRIVMSKPGFEFRIGATSFFKGLEINLVFWRKGINLTLTTSKIYNKWREECNARVQKMKEMRAK